MGTTHYSAPDDYRLDKVQGLHQLCRELGLKAVAMIRAKFSKWLLLRVVSTNPPTSSSQQKL